MERMAIAEDEAFWERVVAGQLAMRTIRERAEAAPAGITELTVEAWETMRRWRGGVRA